MRTPRGSGAAVAAAALAGLVMSGCAPAPAGSHGSAAGCADPVPASDAELAKIPGGLDLSETGTVTEVTTAQDFVSVIAVTESNVDELFRTFPGVLAKGGYDVVADEHEGIEADLFFATKADGSGSVRFTAGPCEGQATIHLTLISQGV